MNQKFIFAYIALIALIESVFGCSVTDPVITSWKKCNGTNNGMKNNVQKVFYSTNYVYTNATSIPDYTIGR